MSAIPLDRNNPNVTVIDSNSPGRTGTYVCTTCRGDLIPIEKNKERYWHCCYCHQDYHTKFDIMRKRDNSKVKSILGGTFKTESNQLEQTVFIAQTQQLKASSILQDKELENDTRIPASMRNYAKKMGAKLIKYSDDKMSFNA